MPLQHVSAHILRAMRRGGNRNSLSRLIDRIRRGVPGVTLRTTMIVGYPGETERDFEELKTFCRDMEFDRLGVFCYSDEEGTASFDSRRRCRRQLARRGGVELMRQQAEDVQAEEPSTGREGTDRSGGGTVRAERPPAAGETRIAGPRDRRGVSDQ